MEWKITVIKAFDIPDAWYQCVRAVLEHGYKWKIQKGSFEGHERIEFDNVCITISNPDNKPLVPDVPQGVPPPTSQKYINAYLAYLFTPEKKDEEYTYGERIASQIYKAVEMLKRTPMTNQCTIEIARPEDFGMKDPPCLRLIDCRIRYGALHFFLYFRSWDLWSGFPPNMASLELLKQWMAKEIGVKNGTLNAWSKGLHLYDFQWKYAKKLTAPRGRKSKPLQLSTGTCGEKTCQIVQKNENV